MMRPISPGLSPNTEMSDAFLSLQTILSPWSYRNGDYTVKITQWLMRFFSTKYIFLFNSGRGSLYAVLKAAGVKEKDEVILQAFTCVAVVDAIIATGAKPIYADISTHLTLDKNDVAKKISPKTKAIIFQHTFGVS